MAEIHSCATRTRKHLQIWRWILPLSTCCRWVTCLTSVGALLCTKQMSTLVTRTDRYILTPHFGESKHTISSNVRWGFLLKDHLRNLRLPYNRTQSLTGSVCVVFWKSMVWSGTILYSYKYNINIMDTGITRINKYRDTRLDIPKEQRAWTGTVILW